MKYKQIRTAVPCILAALLLLSSTGCSKDVPAASEDSSTETTVDQDMNFAESSSASTTSSSKAPGAESSDTSGNGGGGWFYTAAESSETETTVAVDVEEVKKKIDVNGGTCVIMSNNSADNPDGKMMVDYYKEYCNGNLQFLTYSYEDLAIKLQASVLADNPPDIYTFRNQDFPQLLYKDYLASLNSTIDFSDAEWQNMKSSLDKYSWGGQYYLVPFTSTSRFIWYNKTVFKNAGLDTPGDLVAAGNWTWDSMFKLASDVTDPNAGIYGFARGSNLPYAIMASAGTDLVKLSDTGIANNITSTDVTDSMNYLYKLANSGIYPVDTDTTYIDQLKQGKLGMLYEGRWLAQSDSTLQKLIQAGDVDMVMFPRKDSSSPYRTLGEISGYAMAKGCKNTECAQAFLTMIALNSSLKEQHFNQLHDLYYDSSDFRNIFAQTESSTVVPVYSLGISAINKSYWDALNRLESGTPWSTLVNELEPEFDLALDTLGQ